jgi:hypothetical protein
MDISELSIPYVVGILDKITLKSTTKIGHIEVPLWQGGFPRNASEGQLSAFKQAGKLLEFVLHFLKLTNQNFMLTLGNKALSSVTSHFSRLKPSAISRNLGRSVSKKKEVSDQVIKLPTTGPPNTELRMPSSYSSLNDLTSFSIIKDVLHLPSAGVLFLTGNEFRLEVNDLLLEETKPPEKPPQPKVLLRCVSAGQFDSRCLPKGKRNGELGRLDEHIRLIVTPEIQISTTEGTENTSQASVQRLKLLSHSSERIEVGVAAEESNLLRASSETSLGSNPVTVEMKNSKSDYEGLLPIGTSVLTSFKIPSSHGKFNMGILTSPTSVKGNPLVMLAKGVQNLGANLDPRKMLDSNKKDAPTSKDNENDDVTKRKLCTNTRIIRL